jgi:hypothetical protein
MNQHEFFLLFTNANTLAEVALQKAMHDVMRSLPDEAFDGEPREVTELSALIAELTEGEAWTSEQWQEQLQDVELPSDPFLRDLLEQLECASRPRDLVMPQWDADDHWDPENQLDLGPTPQIFNAAGDMDVGPFLEFVYDQEERLAAQMTRFFARVDLAALRNAIAQMPADVTPFTSRLSRADFSRWLDLYASDLEPLAQVVHHIRGLVTPVDGPGQHL